MFNDFEFQQEHLPGISCLTVLLIMLQEGGPTSAGEATPAQILYELECSCVSFAQTNHLARNGVPGLAVRLSIEIPEVLEVSIVRCICQVIA